MSRPSPVIGSGVERIKMDVLESLEVRWFMSDFDPVVAVAVSWFGPASREGSRVDDYLLTGRTDLGFKARAVENQPTKIETKYLIGSLGAVTIAPGVTGKLERWRKLSLALEDPKLKKDGAWLTVEKDRQLRKFAFQSGAASEVPVGARPDAGCGVELTRLRYWSVGEPNVRTAWTLGLEAFGPEDGLLQVLQTTCGAAFSGGLQLSVDSACSMSYPEWLRVDPRGKRP
jgi:hypothetical protein